MRKTSNAPAKNVDEYLAALPAKTQAVLEKLRKTIRSAAPQAEELISYRIPLYKYKGHFLGFAAFTNHCSLFVMSYAVMKTFSKELEGFDYSGSTIRFSIDKPLPVTLIRKIIAARIVENDAIAAKREEKKRARAAAKKKQVTKTAKKKTAKKKTARTSK